MSLATPVDRVSLMRAEMEHLRGSWFWLLVFGVLLIIVGLVAISSAFIATLATVTIVGILLLVGGFVEIIDAFLGRRWRGFWMHMLGGLLYLALGFLLIQRPMAVAAVFTLMIAVAFFIGGIFRIIYAISERFCGWKWVLLNGLVTLVLGILIWREWPESSMWVIGLFVGIDMLFDGWSLVMTALAVKSVASAPAQGI
jgi:uncharacterized membrane protein HdeD (DUF308 family)